MSRYLEERQITYIVLKYTIQEKDLVIKGKTVDGFILCMKETI